MTTRLVSGVWTPASIRAIQDEGHGTGAMRRVGTVKMVDAVGMASGKSGTHTPSQ